MRNDFAEKLKLLYSDDAGISVEEISSGLARYMRDKFEPLTMWIFREDRIPDSLVQDYFSRGYADASLPEGLGGGGLPYVYNILQLFTTAKECASMGLMASVRNTAFQTVLMGENEEHKEKYIREAMRMGKYAAFALTEAGHGTDATKTLDTKATPDGNHYIIDGKKEFITNSDPLMTEFYVVFANIPGKGITPFIVDGDSKDISIVPYTKERGKLGLFGSQTAEVTFNEVRVPDKNRLGEEGGGKKYILGLNTGRLDMATIAAAQAVDAQERAFLASKERVQFEQPIGKFQSVGNLLASTEGEIEGMLGMIYEAAVTKDKRPEHFPKAAISTKTHVTERAIESISDVAQVHGAAFFMEYKFNQPLRNVLAFIYTEGATFPLLTLAYNLSGKFK